MNDSCAPPEPCLPNHQHPPTIPSTYSSLHAQTLSRNDALTSSTTAATTPTPSPSPPPTSAATASTPVPMPLPTSSCPQMAAQCQKSLREAVRNGDSSGLKRLLEAREGKINLNVFDTEGQTPLHQSCQLGNLELVKLLVRFGADVRLANRDGWSALHIAAYGGHTDILLFLMTATNIACRRS